MACEPFQCDECGKQHDRCTGHRIHCSVCDWSGGNTYVDAPCVKCGEPCIIDPCTKWPRKGAPVCQSHGGNAPQVIAATERRNLEAQSQKLLGIEGYEPIVDPFTALSQLAGEVVKLKDVLRDKVEELLTLRAYSGEGASEQIDIHMQAYERALDRAEKILSGMARLDLESRIARLHSRINTDATTMILKAMNDALDAGDISGGVREVVLNVFGARLRGDPLPDSRHATPAISATTEVVEVSTI